MKNIFCLITLLIFTACSQKTKIGDFEITTVKEEDREYIFLNYPELASIVKTASNAQVKKIAEEINRLDALLYIKSEYSSRDKETISVKALNVVYLNNPNFNKDTFEYMSNLSTNDLLERSDRLYLSHQFDADKNYEFVRQDYKDTIRSCSFVFFSCKEPTEEKYNNLGEKLAQIKDSSFLSDIYYLLVDENVNDSKEYLSMVNDLKKMYLNDLSTKQKKYINVFSLFKEDYIKEKIDWELIERYAKNDVHKLMMGRSTDLYSKEHFYRGSEVNAEIKKQNLIKMFKICAKHDKIPARLLFQTLDLKDVVQFKKDIHSESLINYLVNSNNNLYEFAMNNLVTNFHQKSSEKDSYLHVAAQFGDHKRIAKLKGMGLKTEYNERNKTPFDVAINSGYYSLAKQIDEREFSAIAAFLAGKGR